MLPEENHRKNAAAFWSSVPGLLTGIAALITAAVTVYTVFHHPMPTAAFWADPNSIQKGTSTKLSWRTTDADVVKIEELGDVSTTGSREVTPDSSTTYHLTAKGVGGTVQTPASVTVNATPAQDVNPKNPPSNAVAHHASHSIPHGLFGDWQGVLQAPPIAVILNVDVGGTSTDGYGNPTIVTVNGKNVQFSIPIYSVSFSGDREDATITGVFSQRGVDTALTLTKVGDGTDAMNGKWQGTLTLASIPLILHIKPDTGSTCDTPTQGYFGVPANVTSDGTSLQFEVPAAGMSFSGSIRGNEMKGIFSQSGGSFPLTLSKR